MATLSLLPYPEPGHVHPMLPLTTELVRRGLCVHLYGTERFRTRIEQSGATFHSYGEHDPCAGDGSDTGLLAGMVRRMAFAEAAMPALLKQVRDQRPDALLFDAGSVWGNLAAQVLRLPAIACSVSFALNERAMSEQDLLRLLYGRATEGAVLSALLSYARYWEMAQRLEQRYGVRCPNAVNNLGNPQDLNLVFTSRYFQLAAEAFDENYRFVGPQIAANPAAVEFPFEALRPGPLVYIAMGTIFNDLPDFYRVCFEALAAEPVQVVMSTGTRLGADALPPAPANFIVREFVPQLDILRRCSLFITHGGGNSAQEGLLYGVPLLVFPQAADHFAIANRVAELGAGRVLRQADVVPERLRELVVELLSAAGAQQAAETIGASLRSAGGYVRAADEIQTFVDTIRSN